MYESEECIQIIVLRLTRTLKFKKNYSKYEDTT